MKSIILCNIHHDDPAFIWISDADFAVLNSFHDSKNSGHATDLQRN